MVSFEFLSRKNFVSVLPNLVTAVNRKGKRKLHTQQKQQKQTRTFKIRGYVPGMLSMHSGIIQAAQRQGEQRGACSELQGAMSFSERGKGLVANPFFSGSGSRKCKEGTMQEGSCAPGL